MHRRCPRCRPQRSKRRRAPSVHRTFQYVKDRTGTPWAPRVATFLLAETISAVGSFGTMIAIWAYAAYKYDASPAQISLYGIAFSLPGVIFGPVSGLIIDRFGAKSVLLYAKALGVAASIALLFANS